MLVYLADLGHTYFGISPTSIPLGIGYISATLKQYFKDAVEVKMFRYPDKLLAALKEERPDIAGFGIYAWNENLSLYFAHLVRKMYPKTTLIAGGLNIPTEGYKHKDLFDTCIAGDGELPMLKFIDKKASIPEIPSPYLTGILDEMLDDATLMPVVQAMRGCPYRCTFCTAGNKEYSKVTLFPTERLKEEILYIKKKAKNRILRITDDNFGLFERDIEIAEFIKKLYKDENYPHALKVYTSKKINEQTKKVILALREFIPYNISVQTTTPEVLKEIKRVNQPVKDMKEAFRWAKENSIHTASEIMHGLSYETYKTFIDCVNSLYEARVDSVSSGEVWLLPNTELSSPVSRKKHEFKSRFVLAADALSIIDGKVICECDEHITSSKYMSIEEHYKLCAVDLFVLLTLHYGYLRELTYHALTYGIKPMDVYERIILTPGEYPILNKLFFKCIEMVKNSYGVSQEEIRGRIEAMIKSGQRIYPTRFKNVLIGEFVFSDEFSEGVDEYVKAIGDLPASEELKKLTLGMVINPLISADKDIFLDFDFNIVEWVKSGYAGKLKKTKPSKIKLTLPDESYLKDIYNKGIKLANISEKIQLFYRFTNSSCLRRYCVMA